MSYRLQKTNGNLVVELADGKIDTTSTDLTLIGKNYRGFGEIINENLIKLTENFASSSEPRAPLIGQIWYNTQKEKIEVFNGDQFRAASAAIVQNNELEDPSEGDLWIDRANKKLYFYHGINPGDYTLVGPDYNDAQGKTGFETQTVFDIDDVKHVVAKFLVGGNLVAVITDKSFRLPPQTIQQYSTQINQFGSETYQILDEGFNLTQQEFVYQGTADSAKFLLNSNGTKIPADNFISTETDSEIQGAIAAKKFTLTQENQNNFAEYKIVNNKNIIEVNKDLDFTVKIKGNTSYNAVYVNSLKRRVGIFTDNPQYDLDVNGSIKVLNDAVIDGDLTVNGTTTYSITETSRIIDKTIELAATESESGVDDNTASGSGIVILSNSNNNKTLLYQNSNSSWKSSENLDLSAGKEYKINGNTVITKNTLGNHIKYAPGLQNIGDLAYLTAGSIKIDANTVTNVNDNFISFDNKKLINVAAPTSANDVSNKQYVDNEVDAVPVIFNLDVTGLDNPTLDNPYVSVTQILESLMNAENYRNGIVARIHCTSNSFTPISRVNMEFLIDSGNWQWQRTV